MLDRTTYPIGIIESFQSCLAARASLPEIDRIVRVALHFEGASLFSADDESASRRTFAARSRIIRAQAVITIFRHFGIGLALNKARGWTTTGQYRCGCRTNAS